MMQPSDRLPEVEPLRLASRQIVRELGVLGNSQVADGLGLSQCHALIEIDRQGGIGVAELAARLNLDKSTMSRAISTLERAGLVRAVRDGDDRRKRPLRLTAAGRKRLAAMNRIAASQVQAALELLDTAERRTVLDGMALYARALARLRARSAVTMRAIAKRDEPAVGRLIRTVWQEFSAVGPGYPISDGELDRVFEDHRPPRAGYFVLEDEGGRLVGGGGFGPLAGADAGTCEVRKMYFLPEVRGLGLGRELLGAILDAARAAGYRVAYLETLARMVAARALYASFGFEQLAAPRGATGHFGCDAWYAKQLG
jgi:putative acetyltransferase